ncbi:nucleotidyltransferase domain-containing protein [Candidatus Woesearchaeota archaeon]|nr:nucleotidyltransferase domain-containing protein [Candidatus Woesearchaeota archaeon]
MPDNRTKLLQVFFNDPISPFQLRELSRKIQLAPTSIKNFLHDLLKNNLIIKQTERNYPVYSANRNSDYFKFLKKLDNIKKIEESGLIEYLCTKYLPDVIILFGSASRGEDTLESDIDLFLQCDTINFELIKYEKLLNRKIHILSRKSFGKLSKELKNNLVNGVILKGYLRAWT